MNNMYIPRSIALAVALACTLSGLRGENPFSRTKDRSGEERVDRVVRGELFRVPNSPFKGSSSTLEILAKRAKVLVFGITDDVVYDYYGDRLKRDGYEINSHENTPFLQVWATTKDYKDTLIINLTEAERNDPDGSCNWADHGHPRLSRFPTYLPLDLFIDEKGELKKDGDEVVLYHNNSETHERIKIILTLNQRRYRYGWCGKGQWDGKDHDGGFDNCVRSSQSFETMIKPFLSK